MERETKTLTIENHTFVAKTYATAKETNAIQTAYFEGAKVEVVGQEPRISEFNPAVQYNVNLALIRELVVEMDGTKENIVERCEDLPDEVFQELVQELDRLTAKKKK